MAPRTRFGGRDVGIFRFLELPADVRLMIYDHLFYGVQLYALDYGAPAHPQHRAGPHEQTMFRRYKSTSLIPTEDYTTILRVSRLIRKEARPILYRHLMVVIPVKRAWKIGRLVANRAVNPDKAFDVTRIFAKIRVLELTINDRFQYVPVNILQRQLPQLKTLILDLSYTSHLNYVLPEISLHPYGYPGGLPGISRDSFDEVMQKDYVKLLRYLHKRKAKLSYNVFCFFEYRSPREEITFFDVINRSEVDFVPEAA